MSEPEINKSSHKLLINDTTLRSKGTVEERGSPHWLLTRETSEDSWGPEAPRRRVAKEMAGQGVQPEVGRGPAAFTPSVSGIPTAPSLGVFALALSVCLLRCDSVLLLP